MRQFLLFTCIVIGLSCSTKKNNTVFEKMTNTGIQFTNSIRNTPDFNIFSYRNYYNGGGVAIGDINNDGLADIFFTANMSSNKLYLNKGNWQFEDISSAAGFVYNNDWSTGVVMLDINNDGWLDIFVCNAGYNNQQLPACKLFINNKDLTFTDKAEEYGLTNKGGFTTHAAFFDYDLDGDLDCFIINNSFIPVNTLNYANSRNLRAKDWPVADFLKGGGDHLYKNENGKFIDVSEEAGIYGSLISFGLGVTVGDINGDMYPDIYVSNDFFEKDYLYINQKNGTFKDELEKWAEHTSLSSMGADMGDVNNDGLPDIFTTDMLPDNDYRLKTTTSFENFDVYRLKVQNGFHHQFTQNTLQINNGNNQFTETAFYSGVAASDWSWGGLIFDADNDGLNDLLVCNGIYHDVTDQDFIDFFANDVVQKMVMTGEKEQFDAVINKMPSKPIPNKLFRNKSALQFEDVGLHWGLNDNSFSNGAAVGDLDNDGDLDIVINNVNQPAFIYQNKSNEKFNNNYISLQLKGKSNNTFAIGSKVYVYAEDEIIFRELIPTRGFQSSIDYKLVIGLGKKKIDSIKIVWPDQTYSTHKPSKLNTTLQINWPSNGQKWFNQPSTPPLFKEQKSIFPKQAEDDFIDFYSERNLISLISRQGPKAAIADVNADGKNDIYLAGPAGTSGKLYIQSNGGYQLQNNLLFEADKFFEETAVQFADIDLDGDLDLIIGAGGNQQPKNSGYYQVRIFLNDGKGNFSKSQLSTPINTFNTSVIQSADIDADGDVDLFIGNYSSPLNYGQTVTSFLWINDGKGNFTTNDNLSISTIGFLKDAIFTNVDADKNLELIVVGEWMAPTIYQYSNGKLQNKTTALQALEGLWQTVVAEDFNRDGWIDLAIGNYGENFYLGSNNTLPLKMFIQDFDENGSQEKVLSRNIDGKDVPVFLKRELTDQIPVLKKQNLKYADYAQKSVQQLFSNYNLNKAVIKKVNYLKSIIAYNDGKGNFNIVPLPQECQLSVINTFFVRDVNQDALPDLIAAGNDVYLQPQFGRLDGNRGNVLINEKDKFRNLPAKQTGLNLTGKVTQLVPINKNEILVLRNDLVPLHYKHVH